MVKWIKLRILLVSLGFIVFLGSLLLRSYELQIANNSRINQWASRQYHALLPESAKRGTIYDRNGKELAMDVQVSSVGVHPQKVKDPESLARTLSSLLKIPSDKIRSKLGTPSLASTKKFEWIQRRIPYELGETLQALKLPGVAVVTEYKRFYPNKELAGHLLGAVGYDAKALGGIELGFDRYLKSRPHAQVGEKDAKGRLYTPVSPTDAYHDVYLTIDLNLQFIAEKYLHENAVTSGVQSGFAIMMDPKTGEILAMANYPSFNPNVYWQYPAGHWKNHALIDSYEPGSTFKTILVASALNTDKVKPTDRFFCEEGAYRVGKQIIHDHESYAWLTVSDIIKVSSNIGITKIAQKIGKEPFYNTIMNLGFGVQPGLDFPGEERGSVRPPKKWSSIDHSNMAFGQGIAVTGLQMAQAYAAFANKGIRMKPWLVQKIVSREGEEVLRNDPLEMSPVVRPEVAASLTRLLEGVVEEGGTGKLAKLDGYTIAGKTGTAEKVDPKTKKYAAGQYVSSFIGYVPSSHPLFLIYVVYDTPQFGSYYGGVAAAPVFANIAKEALAYRGVPSVAEKMRFPKELARKD